MGLRGTDGALTLGGVGLGGDTVHILALHPGLVVVGLDGVAALVCVALVGRQWIFGHWMISFILLIKSTAISTKVHISSEVLMCLADVMKNQSLMRSPFLLKNSLSC